MRKASETWCPFVRHSAANEPASNRGSCSGRDAIEHWNVCIGSKCSAWQSISTQNKKGEFVISGKGFCGLSNGQMMEDE